MEVESSILLDKNCEGPIHTTNKSIKSVFFAQYDSIKGDLESIPRKRSNITEIYHKFKDNFEENIDVFVQRRLVERENAYSFLAIDIKIRNISNSDIKNFEIKKEIIGEIYFLYFKKLFLYY
jgi:hypothetical protein